MAAPRSSWKGYLRVSLVSCPVRLYPVHSEAERVRFHQLAPKSKARIKLQPVDPTTGEQVDRGKLLKGYEVDKDRYVVITDEDLDKVMVESSRVIDVAGFVDEDAIDEVCTDSPYYLAPDGKMADEPFRIIREAMRLEGKAGLARVMLSTRERAVMLKPRGKGMLIRTLRAPDEVRKDAPYFEDIEESPLNDEMVTLARSIVRQKSMKLTPDAFEDRYQAALRRMVEQKLRGETVTAPKGGKSAEVIDLMDALKRSLGASKPPAGNRRSRAKPAAGAAKPARKRARG